MGAVTYPHPNVARLVEDRFVPVQMDITRETPEVQQAIERFRQVWTPTILVLNSRGQEIRRSQGYFPPEEFIPELMLGLGQLAMLEGNFDEAVKTFESITGEHSSSKACEEATYWKGVSLYKRDKDANKLTEIWKELKEKYPDSPWWEKASFIAD